MWQRFGSSWKLGYVVTLKLGTNRSTWIFGFVFFLMFSRPKVHVKFRCIITGTAQAYRFESESAALLPVSDLHPPLPRHPMEASNGSSLMWQSTSYHTIELAGECFSRAAASIDGVSMQIRTCWWDNGGNVARFYWAPASELGWKCNHVTWWCKRD